MPWRHSGRCASGDEERHLEQSAPGDHAAATANSPVHGHEEDLRGEYTILPEVPPTVVVSGLREPPGQDDAREPPAARFEPPEDD